MWPVMADFNDGSEPAYLLGRSILVSVTEDELTFRVFDRKLKCENGGVNAKGDYRAFWVNGRLDALAGVEQMSAIDFIKALAV